jgi:transglutaminase-like putative cysteine protease
MKKYAFTFTVHQEFDAPILKHSFLLRCMPGTYPFQRSYAHKLSITPHAALTHIPDVYGNEMYTGTIDKAHQTFAFTASGFVLSSKYLTHDPLDRLYLYPTPLTQPTPGMTQLIASGTLPEDPWARAKSLCALTHRLLHFTPETQQRTAAEVFSSGQGDARDFAHVFLALCRLSGIAARFVSGLAVGIPTAHAWAEVYCGNLWRALDPYTGLPAEDGYLKIAHGPDYDACAVERSCYRDSSTPHTREVPVVVTEHVVLSRDTVPHA